MERGNERRRNRGRARGGGGGFGGADGGGGGGGGGFGGGIGGGAGRGGTLQDEEFAASDEHQRALVAAFAVHRQLLPPSEADAREVSEMNYGYRSAVAAAAARGGRQPSGRDERPAAAAAATAAARAELDGLMRKYLEVRELRQPESERSGGCSFFSRGTAPNV